MKTLSDRELKNINAYLRAANYLSVGQLYLKDNPLLREKLTLDQIKPNVVGHWGTAPGQNFVYVHLNRIIKKYNLDMIYISGPGHGGQAMVANTYLEGSYSEIYPSITEDIDGMKKLFKQFSFPGGISSHVAPETPGSINEGGELGYSLSHAFGAVLDNPDLIAACVVGDGEAETGPLAASWHLNKIINPLTDGIVLPILHLNGYKIANPTIYSRIPEDELIKYFEGCGWNPYVVEASSTAKIHELMARTLDRCIEEIKIIKSKTRLNKRATFPMIILKTPKGWGGPKFVNDLQVEGTFRSHQVPVVVNKEHPENLEILEAWLRSYKPEELFDENGTLKKELKELAPKGNHRMGMNPHANGGLLLEELNIPDFRGYGVEVKNPGETISQDMMELGYFIRDIIKLNENAIYFLWLYLDNTTPNDAQKTYFVGNIDVEGEYIPNIAAPNNFSTDSWSTIVKAVQENNIGKYNVGDTKEIDMGTYGTHTLRIANKSTPSECSTEGFSQTACGFVLEFQDIITTSKMNNAYSNTGGWNNAEMNTFINNNIYNALPNELKEIIIDTIVVSSYGKNDTANFTTTNKLYLLAPKEIYTDYAETTDTAKDLTRILDYYKEKRVTMNSYANAIKYNNSTATWWWLRNVPSSNSGNFFGVNVTGILNNNYAHFVGGVSPAFRIG